MKIVLMVLAMALISCAPMHAKTVYIAPSAQKHVDQFLLEASKRGIVIEVTDLIIVVQEIDKDFDGVCIKMPFTTPTIKLQPRYWYSTSVALQEQLLFHELGHCVLVECIMMKCILLELILDQLASCIQLHL